MVSAFGSSDGSANSRHAMKMEPSTGLTANTVPWFSAMRSLSFAGLLHVAPQSVDRENMIFDRGLFVPPTNDV